MKNIAQYRKTIVACIGAGVLIATTAGAQLAPGFSDSAVQLVDGAIGVLTALGVFRVPNAPADA